VNFRTYFHHLFEQPERQVTAATVVRTFSIWFFGLLRNFVLVGLSSISPRKVAHAR